MKKALLIFILVNLLIQAQATTFYVDSIYVSPINPTNTNNITLTISGDLCDGGAIIHSCHYSINGTNIAISIDCSSDGGCSCLVPHDEEINIGSLPAGDYHISVYGSEVSVNLDNTSQSDFHVENDYTIRDNKSNDLFSIYPCPTYNNSKVLVESDNQIQSIRILNTESKIIFQQHVVKSENVEIIISDWPSGVYFIQLICDEELYTRRIIVQ